MIDRAGLVIVDMQNGLVNARSKHVVPAVVELVTLWERAGGKTVFTRYVNRSVLHGRPGTSFVPELLSYVHRAVAILDTVYFSCFSADGGRALRATGWRDLVLCGLDTETGVLLSAVDGHQHGYVPWIVTDACGSDSGLQAHEAGLFVAGRLLGSDRLATAAQVLRRFAPAAR